MNILIFSHSSGVRGGAERAVLDILDGLPKKITPTVCLPSEGELTTALKDRDIPYVYTNINTGWNIEQEFVRNVSSLNELLNILKEEKYSLIISNSSVYPWGGIVARLLNVPHLWIVHEIIQNDSSVANRVGIDDLYTINELADCVIANSKATKVSLEKYIDKSKLKVQYLPIKLNPIDINKTLAPKITNNTINVVSLGRVIPLKRQLDVAKALNIVAKDSKYNINLHLVGEADPKYVKQIIIAINNTKIKLIEHGHLENIDEVLKIAHIGVISSEVESFGRATYEMLASGIPVVATNSGATPELIQENYNGYLYKVGDIKALSVCLDKTIKSKENYKKLSNNALQIKDQFNYKKLIKQIIRILDDTATVKTENSSIINRLLSKSIADITLMNSENNALKSEIAHLKAELNEVYSSKAWKAIKKARDTKGRLRLK